VFCRSLLSWSRLWRSWFSFLRNFHQSLISADICACLIAGIILKACPNVHTIIFFHLAAVLLHLLSKFIELWRLINIFLEGILVIIIRWSFSHLYVSFLIFSYEIFALIFRVEVDGSMRLSDTFLWLSSLVLVFVLIVIIRIWKNILINRLLFLLFGMW
jgi:hypothetical protein